MARFIESDNRRFKVLAMHRAEAALLIKDLTSQLIMAAGGAAQVTVYTERREYQLLFQVDPKKVETPGITEEDEDLGPVRLVGLF